MGCAGRIHAGAMHGYRVERAQRCRRFGGLMLFERRDGVSVLAARVTWLLTTSPYKRENREHLEERDIFAGGVGCPCYGCSSDPALFLSWTREAESYVTRMNIDMPSTADEWATQIAQECLLRWRAWFDGMPAEELTLDSPEKYARKFSDIGMRAYKQAYSLDVDRRTLLRPCTPGICRRSNKHLLRAVETK